MSDPTQLRERAIEAERAHAPHVYFSGQIRCMCDVVMPAKDHPAHRADAVLAEVAAEVEARRDADIASGNDCHALNQPIRSADFISRADALTDLLSVLRPSEGEKS